MVSLKKIQVGEPSKISDLAIQKLISNKQEQNQDKQNIEYYPKNMEELIFNFLLAFKIIYIQLIALFETFVMIIRSFCKTFSDIHQKNGLYFFFELIKNLTLFILCFNIKILQFLTKSYQQPQQNSVKKQ